MAGEGGKGILRGAAGTGIGSFPCAPTEVFRLGPSLATAGAETGR